MPLVSCRECKNEVSSDAETCPHCGTKYHFMTKAKFEKTQALGCVIYLICFLCLFFIFSFVVLGYTPIQVTNILRTP